MISKYIIYRVIKTAIIGSLFLAFFFREILYSIRGILTMPTEFNWPVIPLFILSFVLLLIVHKDKIKPLPAKCSGWGLLLAGMGLIVYLFVRFFIQIQYLCSIIQIFVLLGSIILLFGWNIVRITWMSFVLLFFMIPLPGRIAYHEPALIVWRFSPYGITVLYFLILWLVRNLFIEDNSPQTGGTQLNRPEIRLSCAAKKDESVPQPDSGINLLNDIPFLSAGIVYLVAMIIFKYLPVFALNGTQPVALQKSLQALDQTKLGSYKVIEKFEITNEDILNVLGTREYLQWRLEDTDVPRDSAVRFCLLFITYYPSKFQVYSPEQTYIGGGNVLLQKEQAILNVPIHSAQNTDSQVCTSLNIQYVVFENRNTPSQDSVSVMYFFMANSGFADSRRGVEKIFRNPFNKYSYFSKVEWRFFGEYNGLKISPEKSQVIEASNKLMSIVLPILVDEHWPKTN